MTTTVDTGWVESLARKQITANLVLTIREIKDSIDRLNSRIRTIVVWDCEAESLEYHDKFLKSTLAVFQTELDRRGVLGETMKSWNYTADEDSKL